jgi:hypothetical protein
MFLFKRDLGRLKGEFKRVERIKGERSIGRRGKAKGKTQNLLSYWVNGEN